MKRLPGHKKVGWFSHDHVVDLFKICYKCTYDSNNASDDEENTDVMSDCDDDNDNDDDDIFEEECCGGCGAQTHRGEILAGAASLQLPCLPPLVCISSDKVIVFLLLSDCISSEILRLPFMSFQNEGY